MKLNYATMALAAGGLLILVWDFRGLPWTASRLAALLIGLPSLLLLTLARIQLGRAFSIRAKADLLVTTGIYARIRNPIYVFGALTLASAVLWIGKPWFLLAYLVVGPLQIFRSRREERVLTKRFGRAYLDYKQKTWFRRATPQPAAGYGNAHQSRLGKLTPLRYSWPCANAYKPERHPLPHRL